jgi:hypothetical protein
MPLPFRSFPLACALIASCALAGPAAVADVIPVTIHLAAMNGSGETGVATLTAPG